MKQKHMEDKEVYKTRLLMTLFQHVGKSNAIPMSALFERVYQEPWADRINDTRPIRMLITELRREGVPVCSAVRANTGGYYVSSVGSELKEECDRLKKRALGMLSRAAMMSKTSMPDLLGQMSLEVSK